MATARRAYTAEYSYRYAPEAQPERVRRTRERPQAPQTGGKRQTTQTLSPASLRAMISAVVIIGAILIGIVLVNAQAAKLQYSINQLKNENSIMETEINMMNVKIESSTGISQLEKYAVNELGMHYPQGNECIHLSSVKAPEEILAALIREKAYE